MGKINITANSYLKDANLFIKLIRVTLLCNVPNYVNWKEFIENMESALKWKSFEI